MVNYVNMRLTKMLYLYGTENPNNNRAMVAKRL